MANLAVLLRIESVFYKARIRFTGPKKMDFSGNTKDLCSILQYIGSCDRKKLDTHN